MAKAAKPKNNAGTRKPIIKGKNKPRCMHKGFRCDNMITSLALGGLESQIRRIPKSMLSKKVRKTETGFVCG